ncbi:MAG: sulfotransferase family protein [Pseudomonadota bacterium]
MVLTLIKRAVRAKERAPDGPWDQVAIHAPETVDLIEQQNQGYLEVTLQNSSRHAIESKANNRYAFAYRVLDANGKQLETKGPRTSLETNVAPGDSHTQVIHVAVSARSMASAAAISVSIVQEGNGWLDKHYPNHAKKVSINRVPITSSTDFVMNVGDKIWPRKKNNKLRWPFNAMMVSEQHKILYVPIAKCACTSIKSLMVELAEIQRPDVAEKLGVHMITDRFNTGAQLKDKPMELARQILAADEYLKFSVIRNPFERLVSAYLEKFVYNRHNPRNVLHTKPVLQIIQESEEVDLETGISFDEFATFILGQDPYTLDPHWRPQSLYLRGIGQDRRIFRIEDLAELEQRLTERCGYAITLKHDNVNKKADIVHPEITALSADKVQQIGGTQTESFSHSAHYSAIRRYYSDDYELYETAAK